MIIPPNHGNKKGEMSTYREYRNTGIKNNHSSGMKCGMLSTIKQTCQLCNQRSVLTFWEIQNKYDCC